MAALGDFSRVPDSATLSPKPFRAEIPEEKLQQMNSILAVSPVGPAVWENTSKSQGETTLSDPTRKNGMRRDYLAHAKKYWLNTYDWRKTEERINSFPNFTVDVVGEDGLNINIHFVGLFSDNPDAIPLAFYHGWPGSFLEFLQILDILKTRYTPKTLPYHVIVPSLPGYTFSSGPPIDTDYALPQAVDVLHHLMVGLGFKSYLVQGGDVGSAIVRGQLLKYSECRSGHLNLCFIPSWVDQETTKDTISPIEARALDRKKEFLQSGIAYSQEHNTRPATIGLALGASPLALFAWVGEKFLEWSDEDPNLDDILDSVSLYWLTDTFSRSIYPYRSPRSDYPYIEKPIGFSFFPKELFPSPKYLIEQVGNLVNYSSHESGGHFAALEKPKELLADVEEWVQKVWKVSQA